MRHKSRSAAKTTAAPKLHIPEDLLVKSNLSRREAKALNPHLLRDTLFGFRHHGWRKEGTLKVLSNQWRVLAIVGLVAASLTSAPRRLLFSARKGLLRGCSNGGVRPARADHHRQLRCHRGE